MPTGSGRAWGFAIFSEKVFEGGEEHANQLYYKEKYLSQKTENNSIMSG
jgi:hypothetical protein